MKYYIIAGEASGDMHASNLMKQIKLLDSQALFRCWGGDRMQASGGHIVKHIRELAFMGFTEVLLNLRAIFRNFSLCKRDLLEYAPDVLILVDYPGFNLRMAAFAHKKGIRVVYYISPQIWAWKQSRIKKIRRFVDKMLVILPFEQEFYKRHGLDVTYVGHPLLDMINETEGFQESTMSYTDSGLNGKKRIALLPGSRKQEILRHLQPMATLAAMFPQEHFIVAGMSVLPKEIYHIKNFPPNLSLVFDQTYTLLRGSDAAIVASGTATLETALFGIPQLVCYRAGRISAFLARLLIRVRYISLVNLIMNRPVVKELIQKDMNPDAMFKELSLLLYNENHIKQMAASYQELKNTLGSGGASSRAADEIVSFLRSLPA